MKQEICFLLKKTLFSRLFGFLIGRKESCVFPNLKKMEMEKLAEKLVEMK